MPIGAISRRAGTIAAELNQWAADYVGLSENLQGSVLAELALRRARECHDLADRLTYLSRDISEIGRLRLS